MKKLFKQTFAIIMTVAMIFTIAPLSGFLLEAEAETLSGTFEYNELKWTFDTDEGVLEFTGAGYIPEGSDYEGETIWPYSMEKDDVKVIKIADDVRSIGDYAFEYCNNLTSVVIGDGVTAIGNFAFYKCASLKTVDFGKSVKTIGYDAFNGCASLESITLSDSVTTVSRDVFSNCTNLKNITISASVTSLSRDAFKNCNSLESFIVDENNKHYSSDSEGVLFNKDKTTLIKYPEGNTKDTYTIPDSVITIEADAFRDCVNLANIIIPESVKKIGMTAFENTKYYNDADNWTDDVLYLDDCLVASKSTLSGACTIKGGTKVIANGAFYGCGNLESVKIDNAPVSIGAMAFYDCKKLTEISLPDTVTNIGRYAFINTGYYDDSDNWTEDVLYIDNHLIKAKETLSGKYIIKDNTKTIAEEAFYNFEGKKLTNVIIPDSVICIDDDAFSNCVNLTAITLPKSLKEIGNGAFGDCSYLTDVFYSGGKEDWEKIAIGTDNEELTSAIIHHNYSPNDDIFTVKTTPLVSVVNTVNGPKLTWKEVEDAEGYYVYRRTSDTTWLRLGSTAETSFADKTAKSGTDYIYTAKAYNKTGTSNFQSGLTIKYLEAPKITLIRNSTRGVRIEWEPVEGATGYIIFDKTISRDYYTRTGTTTSTSFEWGRDPSGTTSYYTVRAVADNENTMSSYRAGKKIKYLVSPTVSSVVNTVSGVKISWNNIAGASGYYVYRKTSATGSYTKIGTTTTRNFTDKTAKSGTTYYYTVRAYSGSTLSSYRAGVKVKYLTSPTISSAVNTTSGVKIAWNKIAGASTYHIYRKTSATGSYSRIGTSKTTSFTDTTAEKGTTYYYTVRASYGLNLSSYRVGTKITMKK